MAEVDGAIGAGAMLRKEALSSFPAPGGNATGGEHVALRKESSLEWKGDIVQTGRFGGATPVRVTNGPRAGLCVMLPCATSPHCVNPLRGLPRPTGRLQSAVVG